jgi:Fe-S cluster assembly protein SufD
MKVEVRPVRTAAETALDVSFAALRDRLPGAHSFATLREEAFGRFRAQGLPHRRIEAWKYTDLRALMHDAKPLAEPPDAAATLIAARAAERLSIDARRLVFVDGAFVPELSDLLALEPGLSIRSLAQALAEADPLVASHLGRILPTDDVAVALNTAFMGDGAVIRIGEYATLARPLQLVFINSGVRPAAVFTRSLVIVEKHARAMLVERYEGAPGADDDYQVNTALELQVAEGAHVDHIKITGEGAGAMHLSTLMASIGPRVRFNEFLFTTGGGVVRNQMFVRFTGEDTVAGIRGATMLRARQHADATLVAEHAAGGSTSRELFKTVADGESRGIFQGKIIVRPHAQKTDAKMASHALLLSETAEADNKPELEIFADDVQCGHGATAGALDEDLLFYLHARGVPPKEAEGLLIQAFVGEAIEGIEHAGLRDALMDDVAAWLAARG